MITHPEPPPYWGTVNCRRGELIDRRIAGSITPDEERELGMLQEWADAMLRWYAPRDLTELERLEERMKEST